MTHMAQDYRETGRNAIENGTAVLGIELGSTRIKAVLIDAGHTPIASGGFEWENSLENGVWTYRLEDVWAGLQACYRDLAENVEKQYGIALKSVGALGISAMMHGYLVFDGEGNQLVPFRTWRNTITGHAAGLLTEAFGFNIPQRWSIAHLYQSILNGEAHVKDIAYMTTLAGYVHWRLTGEFVLGVGDASGMFPIDSATNTFHPGMLGQFDARITAHGYPWRINGILPRVLCAGEHAGRLTEAGAKLLDPSGQLASGTPLCPPEGDAGTGMVATNSVKKRTGNISAGTSIFAMVVLEQPLKAVHTTLDMVTTPSGFPVAMVHCNNGTSDLDAWVRLIGEAIGALGVPYDKATLYKALYNKALEGDADGGGLIACNYLSGEHITGFTEGRPLFVRKPDADFTLANFMRTHIYAAAASLRIGMDILTEEEGVALDLLRGHGGFFKTPGTTENLLAAALNVPVSVMKTAGEGGAWGIALLAAYLRNHEKDEALESYLEKRVFADITDTAVVPAAQDVEGFLAYMRRYRAGLEIEKTAVKILE